MGRILGLITGIKLPSLGTMIVIGVVLFVVGGVGFLGYDYSQRGIRIDALEKEKADELVKWQNEKKIWIREQMALMDVQDSLVKKVEMVLDSARTDRENYAKRENQMQLTIRDVRKNAAADVAVLVSDRDYWKDYAEKLESGDYEVKMGVWPFRGKKLVKKAPLAPGGGAKKE